MTDDDPTRRVTVGEFIVAGVTDLRERVGKLDELRDADDLDYWLEERELVRTVVRLLRRVDDELTYRLTGERVLHGQFFDHLRLADAERIADGYDLDDARDRHPATFNPEVSLAESEAEAEWRRFTERNQ